MADINEIHLWEWCKTHGDYAGYLMRYPNGSYAAEAKALLINENDKYNHLNEIILNQKGEKQTDRNFKDQTMPKNEQFENKKDLKSSFIPWPLILSCLCNILAIVAIIVGLTLNKVSMAGFELLGLGFMELITYFVIPSEKRLLIKGHYLFYSGVLSLIGGFVFSLI